MQPDGRLTSRRRVLVFALIIIVLPLLTLAAFHAASTMVVSNAPLFRFENGAPSNGLNQSAVGTRLENYTGSNISVATINLNTFPSMNLPTVSPDVVIAIILVVFAIVTFGVVRNLRYSRRLVLGFDAEEQMEERAAVAKVLDDAVDKLKLGGEYRMTVLQCYRLISEILEKKSKVQGSTLTAREFKDLVSKRLGLDSPHLSQATDLFEVARYSQHEVTEDEAKRAIDCLSNLSNSIKEA